MKVTFYTLGCKVNQYETEAMREAFAAAGHTPVPNSAPFDAAVINSCTVTAESDRKTRQILHKVRRENPIIFFAITQEEIRQTTGFAYLFGEYYPFSRQNIFFSGLSF